MLVQTSPQYLILGFKCPFNRMPVLISRISPAFQRQNVKLWVYACRVSEHHGSRSCHTCPVGFYADQDNSMCTPCPAFLTSSAGASSLDQCFPESSDPFPDVSIKLMSPSHLLSSNCKRIHGEPMHETSGACHSSVASKPTDPEGSFQPSREGRAGA